MTPGRAVLLAFLSCALLACGPPAPTLTWSASPTIAHTDMSYSNSWGLWSSKASTPKLEENTFGHNTQGDTFREP